MNQIIDDLLEYSRLERTNNSKERIMIKELIASVISIYRDDLETGRFNLIVNAPDIEILADSKGLKIALRNLLGNAIKFSSGKPEPVIRIDFQERKSKWIMSVNDNGVGFEMKYSDFYLSR